ncbi:hypothetical protein AXG93_2528s1880 [Marchantia polymorpha subsp. ruderalis]|uniref:Uncharacterized protein n=1 Tax=Marchantia polymorpha subsp. ruderalis TaxID=1480154 RepID=A0A176WQC5_MARPO|nr:hypothetical protein AXG93_2528s1880 [Marchantia polymorpha subsp. ruderalis]
MLASGMSHVACHARDMTDGDMSSKEGGGLIFPLSVSGAGILYSSLAGLGVLARERASERRPTDDAAAAGDGGRGEGVLEGGEGRGGVVPFWCIEVGIRSRAVRSCHVGEWGGGGGGRTSETVVSEGGEKEHEETSARASDGGRREEGGRKEAAAAAAAGAGGGRKDDDGEGGRRRPGQGRRGQRAERAGQGRAGTGHERQGEGREGEAGNGKGREGKGSGAEGGRGECCKRRNRCWGRERRRERLMADD